MTYLRTVHYDEPLPQGISAIYLFGPSDFRNMLNWHNHAIDILERYQFPGAVAIPTPRDNIWRPEDAANQTRWQFHTQRQCHVGVFWVPRMGPMTNVEFGSWCEKSLSSSQKAVLGLPDDVPGTGCLIDYATEYNIPRFRTLDQTLHMALRTLQRMVN